MVADMEKLTGVEAQRVHVDKGYRSHDHPNSSESKSADKSGASAPPPPFASRESAAGAVEPVIGHIKAEHCVDPNYLKGHDADRINAVLAAAGYNFGLLLRWLAELLHFIIYGFLNTVPTRNIT